MSTSSDLDPTFAGWRKETIGVVGPLSLWEAGVIVVAFLPILVALSRQQWILLALFVPLLMLVAALVIPRFQERPLYKWVWQATLHRVSGAAGTAEYMSKAASGVVTKEDLAQLDLPGPLAGLKVHDGPPAPQAQMQRVCIVQDPDGWWTIVASMNHRGLSLQNPEEKLRFAAALGEPTAAMSRADGPLRQWSLYVRSVPDDGTERSLWHRRHLRPDEELPPGAREALNSLEESTIAGSVRHEIYAAFRFRESELRSEAKSSGGGFEGRAKVIYRSIPELTAQLASMGCEDINWLTTRELAGAIRSGYNLGGSVAESLALDAGVPAGTVPGAAGPVRAPVPTARAYAHDAYVTTSYSVLLPDLGTKIGRLAPLLTPRTTGERRTLAIHYEAIPADKAERVLARDQSTAQIATDIKRARGFRVSRRQTKHQQTMEQQEEKIALGYGLVRCAAACSVTVGCDEDIDAHAALIEASARRADYALMRLELAQPAGFVAAVLPLGIGLPARD